jgi:hypothetical protein
MGVVVMYRVSCLLSVRRVKVFSSAFVALWLLLPPPVVAGTDNQKQALAEYQTSALYKDVLSYYNPATKEFSENIYDDEVAIGKVNELFLAMVRDEGFPINVTPDIRDKLDSSLAMVELEYPESERMALYKKLDCSVSVAGFALEGIGCGLGNFNRLSGATLLELTTNTLLLAPLTALDFVTVGGGTTAKVAVKASTKSSKLSLLKKLAGKRSVELATKMGAKITKVRAALGRATLHYFKSSAHVKSR